MCQDNRQIVFISSAGMPLLPVKPDVAARTPNVQQRSAFLSWQATNGFILSVAFWEVKASFAPHRGVYWSFIVLCSYFLSYYSSYTPQVCKNHVNTPLFFSSSQDGSSKPVFYLFNCLRMQQQKWIYCFKQRCFLTLQIILATFILFSLKACFNGSEGWSHWALMHKSAISMDLIY